MQLIHLEELELTVSQGHRQMALSAKVVLWRGFRIELLIAIGSNSNSLIY